MPDSDIKEIRHEDHIVHEDGRVEHIVHADDWHDYRSRREVRNQIVGFRRGAYLILDIIEIMLIAEFFVKLFGFNPANPLVGLIDILSYPLYVPFAGFVTTITSYFIINWSILIAMVVYALVIYLIVNLYASGIRFRSPHGLPKIKQPKKHSHILQNMRVFWTRTKHPPPFSMLHCTSTM